MSRGNTEFGTWLVLTTLMQSRSKAEEKIKAGLSNTKSKQGEMVRNLAGAGLRRQFRPGLCLV